ncbi:MAG: Mur ligase family protein [Balneolaceae bacterium]|jgi:dihydrofolate synthase/folylpolyglutamate synthase
MKFLSVKDVEQYLEEIPKFSSVGSKAAKFDLSRFETFCGRIGNPQENFLSIHVGGTNGKGSTCHILGTIFQESAYKVGVYTSPHILRFSERFTINGETIPDEELVYFFQQYQDLLEHHELTYFEISTALAFWWFEKSNVDLAVIEVGLGGRLDATNIIDPLVSVITSVSLDHTDILGDRIEDIAREKAGIIKAGKNLVIGDLPEKARAEVFKIAKQRGSKVITIDELNPQYERPGIYRLEIGRKVVTVRANLVTPVQAKNLAIAWRVVQMVKESVPVSLDQYLSAVETMNPGIGRFNKLLEDQHWYFDGGHNIEAVRAMKQSAGIVGSMDRAILVLSMMRDKIRPDLMTAFSEFKNIYYYQLNLERAATFDDIKQWLPQVNPIPCTRNHQSFLNDFDSELVIFAGSFYFYRKVRDWVQTFALNR